MHAYWCLFWFFSGILIFLLLTASDNKKLNSTLNETFDFAKTRIERYEIYNTNDQVKSLVRLMDKTTELSRVIAQEAISARRCWMNMQGNSVWQESLYWIRTRRWQNRQRRMEMPCSCGRSWSNVIMYMILLIIRKRLYNRLRNEGKLSICGQ